MRKPCKKKLKKVKPTKILPNRIEAKLFLTPALKKYCHIIKTKIKLSRNALGFTFSRLRNALVNICYAMHKNMVIWKLPLRTSIAFAKIKQILVVN